MDELFKKILNKLFLYKIKVAYYDNNDVIKKEEYNEEEKELLIDDVNSAISDMIADIMAALHHEIDQAWWLIETTISDTIDTIRDKREEDKKIKENEEKEAPWDVSDDDLVGEQVICSYADKENCNCNHKHEHLFEADSCEHECTYTTDPLDRDGLPTGSCIKIGEAKL